MTARHQDQTNAVDVAVGHQLCALRLARSLTLDQLGAKIGVTAQQLQKYEVGSNRLSAGRLFDLAIALDVPISTFFQSVEPSVQQERTSPQNADLEGEALAERFGQLAEGHKRVVLSLIESLSDGVSQVSGPSGGA